MGETFSASAPLALNVAALSVAADVAFMNSRLFILFSFFLLLQVLSHAKYAIFSLAHFAAFA